ncbi:kinase-like protein [Schizophyllum commune H4-8]|uniref:kinase-like protein n=1 Tax=Schizophyllum commune (strain H4-8 / FGSC 9210) TaxID=578458 RepID=UPI002160FEBF|nr:kinase-like protein [Schizophyllum commune H4-8]KAI5886645.1 kinase-like protein [Schizophyllum commune H4-8]
MTSPPPVLSLYRDPSRIWPHEFHFGPPTDETEDITFYMPGGYHPVRIGEVFSGTKGDYRIMHKLGQGAFATVWLAQTVSSRAFVALKIPTAGEHGFDEAEMLELANTAAGSDHPRVSEFINKIPIRGPNGLHCGIVTDVVVPLASAGVGFQPRWWRKEVVYGMVQAMAQIHRADMVHGDFHMANIGVTVPLPTDVQAQEKLMQDLGEYELTIVLPIDPAKQTASLPPYIVTPCRWADYFFNDLGEMKPQIKVYDFGNAYRVGTENPAFRCAVEAYAPEVAFAECFKKKERVPIAFSSDVWALGSAIFETITGTTLFRNNLPSMLPERAVHMAGKVPPEWQAWWDSKPREPLSGNPDAWWESPEQRDWIVNGCADEQDANAAICLLRKLLALDPSSRPSCEEILRDPWFKGMAP